MSSIDADEKLLDWVESAALENIRAHIKAADDIKRESNGALTVIIAGASAALAYATKAVESPADLEVAVAAGVLSLYLFALSAILVRKCLRVGVFPPPTNEPKHLNQKNYALNRLREVELRNLQERIDTAVLINHTRSRWLNRVWTGATASPIVLGATFFSLSCLSHLF